MLIYATICMEKNSTNSTLVQLANKKAKFDITIIEAIKR